MQLGPMRAAPYCSQVSMMSFSKAAPAGVSSPKPAVMMMKAFTPFSDASTFTVSGHNFAGITTTARSVGGISFTSWNTFTPCTSSSLGLTTRKTPL